VATKQSSCARSAPNKKAQLSPAIQPLFEGRAYRRALDCFASLAMTGRNDAKSNGRRF
jgi:hypothetical protein